MGSQTAAGSSLAISATGPATNDAAGFAVLTFVDIGQVEKLGSFGASFAKAEFQPLKGAKQKYKGSADFGAIQPSIAIDSADAGQSLLQTASDDETQKLYSFCVTYPDGAKRYFRGRVFGSPETADGADSMLMITPTVEISTKVVKVASSAVAPTPAPTFATQPSVTPTTGTAGSTTYTATPGTVTNGIISSRAWLLNGTSISTTLSAAPQAAGTLTYQETAAGDGGSTVSSVISATVAAAPSPTVTLSSAQSKSEGNSGATLFTYTVTRSASSAAVAVPWSFTAGTTSADDFTGGTYPTGGTVNMAAGVTTGTFSVSVNGDTMVEGDETFTVFISTPSGYVAGASTSATGTILNDDAAAMSLQAIGTDGGWQAGLGSATTSTTNMHVFRSVFTTGQAPVSSVTFTASMIRGADLTTAPNTLRADMEYNGVCLPCTWNGATSISLAGTENDFSPDEMPASAFGVSAFPAAASIAVKLERTMAVGADSVYTYNGPKTGEYGYRAPAGSQSLIGVPGATPTVPSGYATYNTIWRPVLLLGRPTSKMPSVGMFGASIEYGYYATTNDLAYTNAANSAPKYAYGNFARIGESASNFAVGTKRSAYMKYFNICYNGYGGNDFTNNSTPAVAIAALKQVNAILKSAGAKIVIHIRMSPKSDSTNNWIDQAGQTVRTTTGGVGFVDYRAQVDAAMAADTNLAGQFDPNGVFESSGFPGTWKYNGTAKYWTEDGTHPNNPAHNAQIPVFRAEVDNRINAYLSA